MIEDMDPKKRDSFMKEYLETIKRIKDRNMNERISDNVRKQELAEQFAPITENQEKMKHEILKNLEPIKEDIITIKEEAIKTEKKDTGTFEKDYWQKYSMRDDNIDTNFGIKFNPNHEAFIGNTPISFDNDDIIIYNEVYEGTPGLWELITDKYPKKGSYTDDDLKRYRDIMIQTNSLYEDFNPNSTHPRSNTGKKWKNILSKFWQEQQELDSSFGDGLEELIPGQMYFQRNGKCCRIRKHGNSLVLSPYERLKNDGCYIRTGSSWYNGNRFIIDRVKDTPLLQMLL